MKTKNQIKTEAARELRKKQTGAEYMLWEVLRNRNIDGFKFRRQYIVRGFVLDFYCAERRLGIEIDGSVHRQQKDYDKARQEIIKELSVNILRFKNLEIIYELGRVLEGIKKELACIPSP